MMSNVGRLFVVFHLSGFFPDIKKNSDKGLLSYEIAEIRKCEYDFKNILAPLQCVHHLIKQKAHA